jgi:hypothetical protein
MDGRFCDIEIGSKEVNNHRIEEPVYKLGKDFRPLLYI